MKNLEERAKKRVENINIKELLNSPDDVIMRFLICELAEFHKHELNRIIPKLE